MNDGPLHPEHSDAEDRICTSRTALHRASGFSFSGVPRLRKGRPNEVGQPTHVSIDHLCRTTKLNKRYFYESFADLDALAAAVVGEIAAELVASGLRSTAEASVAISSSAPDEWRAVGLTHGSDLR